MQPPIKKEVERTMHPPVKEMSIRDVDYIIELSKTNILYLIFPRYNEKLWLDFWNHPQVVEHFIKPNKPYLAEHNTQFNDPDKFKGIYKYSRDTSKHIIIDYVRKGASLPITQSTLRSEDINEPVIRHMELTKDNTEIIRMTDELEGTDLEALLFGDNYGN